MFVTTTLCEDVPPVLTFPKLRLAVLSESVCVVAMPVPLKAKTADELGALLEMLTVPVRLPAVVGANATLKEVL